MTEPKHGAQRTVKRAEEGEKKGAAVGRKRRKDWRKSSPEIIENHSRTTDKRGGRRPKPGGVVIGISRPSKETFGREKGTSTRRGNSAN